MIRYEYMGNRNWSYFESLYLRKQKMRRLYLKIRGSKSSPRLNPRSDLKPQSKNHGKRVCKR